MGIDTDANILLMSVNLVAFETVFGGLLFSRFFYILIFGGNFSFIFIF